MPYNFQDPPSTLVFLEGEITVLVKQHISLKPRSYSNITLIVNYDTPTDQIVHHNDIIDNTKTKLL